MCGRSARAAARPERPGDDDSVDGRLPARSDGARAASRRSVLAGTAALVGLATTGAASAQDSLPTISAEFDPAEVEDVGETSELTLSLSRVPETGVNGITVHLDLDDAVATFTGESDLADDVWTFATTDPAYSDEAEGDDSTLAVSVNNADGSIEPGDEDLPIATLEVEAVGGGTTSPGVSVDSFQDQLEEEVEHEVSTNELTVPGGFADALPGFGVGAALAGLAAGAGLRAAGRAGEERAD